MRCAWLLERGRWFGYGQRLPASVRRILEDYDRHQDARRTPRERAALIVQGVVAILLVLSLALHLAEVGLIGLAVIILLTAGNGITDEHQIGRAFQEALPFTSLLVVFFTIVAVIHEQHLFQPFIQWVLSLPMEDQAGGAVPRQRTAVRHLGQCLRGDGVHHSGKERVPGGQHQS